MGDKSAKLSQAELDVLMLLAEVWNRWTRLPARDGADNTEFQSAIHSAQHLIALRVARRADPDVWRTPA